MVQLSKAMSAVEEVEIKKPPEIPKELPKPVSKPTKIKSKKISFQGEECSEGLELPWHCHGWSLLGYGAM